MSRLADYLPERYTKTAEIVVLQEALQKWADELQESRNDFFLQLDARTATWGLDTWEKALGLKTDVTRSYDFRRSRIESKLRGVGTTTKAMIKNVAESFSNGEVEIIEHSDEYTFDVVFVGTLGRPPNMDDLAAAIEDIKPAHLAYIFVYIYRTWGDVAHMTWGDVAPYTWERLKGGDL